MSSSGILNWLLRAIFTRSAQFASIWSLPESLGRPKSKNGPSWSRGKGANSRTTGAGSFGIINLQFVSPRAAGERHSAGGMPARVRLAAKQALFPLPSPAVIDLAVKMLRQLAEHAAMFGVRRH